MTLEEAMREIDIAWHSPPVAIDWNLVEEASMVIVAETGKPYIPGEDIRDPRPLEMRGTPDGYDAAVHGEPDGDELEQSEPMLGADWDAIDELLDGGDGGEDAYVDRTRRGLNLDARWSSRARGQL